MGLPSCSVQVLHDELDVTVKGGTPSVELRCHNDMRASAESITVSKVEASRGEWGNGDNVKDVADESEGPFSVCWSNNQPGFRKM